MEPVWDLNLLFMALHFRTQIVSGIIIVKQLSRSPYCENFKGLLK